MYKSQRANKRIASLIAWVCACTAWLSLAPLQFGGQTAYILVDGNSMFPTLVRSDLVLLKPAPKYEIGDIVAYRDPQIGPVIHRIIGEQDDGFVLQGDNNTWVDPYHPTNDDIIARYWLHIPKLGKVITQLQLPHNTALFSGALGLVAMTTLIDEKEDRASEAGGKRRPGRTRGLERPPTPSPSGGPFVPDLLLGLTVGAVAFVALAVFAFTRPLDRATTGTLDYQHTGQFFYTAQAPEDVYDGGAVHPGDPIFRQVVDQIDVRFRYQLETSQSLAASGTYRIDVELGSPDGWTRTFPMQPETAFDGATFSTIDQLDLATFQAAIDTLEERVGVAQKTYRITIVPQVTLAGLLGGQPLESTFSPRLVFELSELQLRLVGSDADDPLEPTESASISTTGSEPNTVTILKRAFPVATLRQFAIFGVTVTLVALGGVGGATWHRTHDDPAAQNHLRFGNQLVTIEDARALLAEAHVIAVASIEDLAKIAERYGVMMLWHRQPAQDDYYVQTDVGLFHYCLAPRAVRAGVEGGADDVAS